MTEATTTPRALARLPHRMTIEAEFLALMDHRDRITARLDQLLALVTKPNALPRSGLTLVASQADSLLYKGGPRS